MTDKQNNPDPIAHAARLLREAAEELRQAHTYPRSEDWGRETDAKAAYDEHMAAAQALEDWEAAVGANGVQALSAAPAEQQAASSAVLKAIREANMQLVRTGDDAFMLVPYKLATAEQQAAPKAASGEPTQEFEKWLATYSTLSAARDVNGYADLTTEMLWHAWQAAAKTKAPEGASAEWIDANARPGLALTNYTCAHDFSVQPSSGIRLCQKCGISETAARKAAPGEPVNGWPVEATIYKRRDEWVLELSGTINDCAFTCRHTQPGYLQPEDVAGLPSLYSEGIAPQQEAQEPVALLVRKNSWRAGQWEVAPPGSPSYGLGWADQRKYVYAAPQPTPAPLSRDQIREVFMAHGFTIKEGQTDLKQYVYDAAYALLGTKPAPLSDDVVKDAARYRWLRATTNFATNSQGERIDVRNQPEKWDAAIDAAIAAQGDTP